MTCQKIVFQASIFGTLVLTTWVTSGVKAQRIRSARFISWRAPMIRAPAIPINPSKYIARADRRVKSHMM